MSAVGYALLWDFDGTLVDSGELWRRSEYTFLNARKLPWNDAASRRLLGGNLELAAHVMAEVTGVRFSVDELRRGLGDAVRDALSRHVPWMPGVRGLLREQHQRGLRSALVTSSYAAIVRTALEQLAYAPFQSWVTREDVERPSQIRSPTGWRWSAWISPPTRRWPSRIRPPAWLLRWRRAAMFWRSGRICANWLRVMSAAARWRMSTAWPV